MTDNQKIERSRNRRLWIAQIVIPTVTAVVGVAVAFPQIGTKIGDWKANRKRKKFIVQKNKKYKIDYEQSSKELLRLIDEVYLKREQEAIKNEQKIKDLFEQVRILQAQINIKETGEY